MHYVGSKFPINNIDNHFTKWKTKKDVHIQSLISREAIEKYTSRSRGAILSICFSLSDWRLLLTASKVAAIPGEVQCRSWNRTFIKQISTTPANISNNYSLSFQSWIYYYVLFSTHGTMPSWIQDQAISTRQITTGVHKR